LLLDAQAGGGVGPRAIAVDADFTLQSLPQGVDLRLQRDVVGVPASQAC